MVAFLFLLTAVSTSTGSVGVTQKGNIEELENEASDERMPTRNNIDAMPIIEKGGITSQLADWAVTLVNPMTPTAPPGTYDVTVSIHYMGPDPFCFIDSKEVLAEIYSMEELPPVTLCCYDMESVWDIYNFMETQDWDMVPDPNGCIDTWTITDKESHSSSHSFHCTQFDQYLGNQDDSLFVKCFDPAILSQDTVRFSYYRNVEGEDMDMGGGWSSSMDYLHVFWYYELGGIWNYGGTVETFVTGPATWTEVTDDETIPVGSTGLMLEFEWISNPVCQYAGAYIDDICFYGVQDAQENKVWQGYNQNPLGDFLFCIPQEFTFPLPWDAEEGCYTFHIQVHACNDIKSFDIPICIEECLDIDVACPTINAPLCYQDLTIDSTICNTGNMDATNVDIKATVSQAMGNELINDRVEEGDAGYTLVNFVGSATDPYWHITDFISETPTHSWYWGVEGTYNDYQDESMHGIFSPDYDLENALGGECFRGGDYFADYNWNLNDNYVAALNEYDSFWLACHFPDGGYYRFGGGELPAFYGTPYKSSNGWLRIGFAQQLGFAGYDWDTDCDGIDDTFVDDVYDFMLMAQQKGWTNQWKCGFGIIAYSDPAYTAIDDPTLPWGGIAFDNAYLEIEEPSAVLYTDNVQIPSLDIGDCVPVHFEKPYLEIGKYIISVEYPLSDCCNYNNIGTVGYHLGADIQVADYTDFIVTDLTAGVGDCCFHVETSGFDNYFTCADCTTGAYADNLNAVLQYKYPIDLSLDASATLTVEDWYEFDWFAVFWGWGPGDTLSLEMCNDVTSAFPHWQTVDYDVQAWESGNYVLNYFDDIWVLPNYQGAAWNTRIVNLIPGAGGVPVFSNDMGIRYHFVTDSKFHDRGYVMDSINLQGDTTLIDFIDDECDDLDDWVCDPLTAGSLWHWDAIGQQWNWWDQAFFPRQYYENMNDALTWVTHVDQAYNTELAFEYRHNIKSGDIVYLEISDDGTNYDLVDTYQANSGGWQPITIPINKWAGGNLWIRFRSTSDSSAAIELGYFEVRNLKIIGMVDLAAPSSTCSLSGTSMGGWYSSDVRVALSASDDVTGIKAIYYKLDGGPQQTYTAAFKVTTNGAHSVEYWAEDNVGNVESPHNTCPGFQIDKGTAPTVAITAPTTGLYILGTHIAIGSNIFIIGGFTVTATASDADSGVKVVKFYMDGTLFGESTGPTYSAYCAVKHMGAGTIKVVAEDMTANTAEATLDVNYYKFF